MSKRSVLELDIGLKEFFFEKLNEINQKSQMPLPQETLYYSSEVLEKFGFSKNFFEIKDGKTQEKVLGLRLLKISELTVEKKKRELKDIGEMALFMTGYFPPVNSRNLLGPEYYRDVGKKAYHQLNSFLPEYLDVPDFYKSVSNLFEDIAYQISIISENLNNLHDLYQKYLLKEA